MAILGTLLGGVFSGLLSGITGYYQSKNASAEAKAQAQQLSNNIKQLQGLVSENRIDMQEALKRIDTMIESTSGDLKKQMEKQLDIYSKNLQRQYTQGLNTIQNNLAKMYTQRGIVGGAATEAQNKGVSKLAEKQAFQEGQTRTTALNNLSRALTNLNTQGTQMKETARGNYQQFRNNALQQIWGIQNRISALNSVAGQNPYTSALISGLGGAGAGISTGLGNLFAEAFTKKKANETNTPTNQASQGGV